MRHPGLRDRDVEDDPEGLGLEGCSHHPAEVRRYILGAGQGERDQD